MVIVNFATNHFLKGQKRLEESVKGKAHFLGLSDYNTIKSPTHNESPYEFKVHALLCAMEKFPTEDIFLWCDASLYLVGDLSKIETIIQEDGYFMEEAGHYVKDWCNARARDWFNLKPEESGFTMFSAGLLGIHRDSDIAMVFFKSWEKSAKAGCFKGDWSNHRHDMTCGSIIAQRLGMKYQKGGSHMAYIGAGYAQPGPGVVFHLQGII